MYVIRLPTTSLHHEETARIGTRVGWHCRPGWCTKGLAYVDAGQDYYE